MKSIHRSWEWSTLRSKKAWMLIALFIITILYTQSSLKCLAYFVSGGSNDSCKGASFDFHDSKLSHVYIATGEESGHRRL